MTVLRHWLASTVGFGWLLAVAVSSGPLRAADEAGFKPLFNGKDLTGWITPEDKSLFVVEDGVILGRTKDKTSLKKNEFLVTEKPYGDFALKVKVKYKSGNSGIQFRSKRASDGAVSGPQADIAAGYWGLFYEERGRGILERFPEKQAAALVHEGDWNDFEITAKGDHVTISLNGTKTTDRVDKEFAQSGIIALQVHAGQLNDIQFKDIMIKTGE